MSIVEFVLNSTSPLLQAIRDHDSFEVTMAVTTVVVGGSAYPRYIIQKKVRIYCGRHRISI